MNRTRKFAVLLPAAALAVGVLAGCEKIKDSRDGGDSGKSKEKQSQDSCLNQHGKIPDKYFELYKAAAKTEDLSGAFNPGGAYLAAVGFRESNHGRDPNSKKENKANAAGPMQFIRSTWKSFGSQDLDDRYDPDLAIPAAAKLLKANGAPDDWRTAVRKYNGSGREAERYADRVMSTAKCYKKAYSWK